MLLLTVVRSKATYVSKGYRTYVKFDPYELAMLRKLKRDLAHQNKAAGKKAPSMAELIQGCVRTAVHMVYGETYGYDELLSKEQFEKLLPEPDTQE